MNIGDRVRVNENMSSELGMEGVIRRIDLDSPTVFLVEITHIPEELHGLYADSLRKNNNSAEYLFGYYAESLDVIGGE